jgi:mannose-6-phosphate isomerase-like protein (cupin superfamily)
MEFHQLRSLQTAARAYLEVLRKPSLSAGVYRLTTGSVDGQLPHTEDEVYYVVAGRSRFTAGDRDVSVAPGDLIYVPASEPHRFHTIEEDLELLVFFAPAEGSSS